MNDHTIVLKPLPGMFRQKPMDKLHRQLRETSKSYIPVAVKYPKEGGIFIYRHMRLYPEKGLPYPEALNDLNVLKRITMGFVSAMSKKSAYGAILGFVFTPWKHKIAFFNEFLEKYVQAANVLVSHHFLQKRFYISQVRELRTFIYIFLKELGFSKLVCSGVSDIFMNFLQYDNAYYFRFVDIITETGKDKLLADPGKEIARLFEIYDKREKEAAVRVGVATKIKPVVKVLRMILLHPKIKRAFKRAVELTDIEKMKADEADRYYCLMVSNYNYMGYNFQTRFISYCKMHDLAGHKDLPPMQEIVTVP